MLLYLSLSFQTPFPSLTFMCFYEDPVSGQWHFLSAILLASSTTGSADQPHPTIHSNPLLVVRVMKTKLSHSIFSYQHQRHPTIHSTCQRQHLAQSHKMWWSRVLFRERWLIIMIIYKNENVPPFTSLFSVSDHKDLLYLVTIAVGRFPELSLSLFSGTSEMERNIPASQKIFIAAHST